MCRRQFGVLFAIEPFLRTELFDRKPSKVRQSSICLFCLGYRGFNATKIKTTLIVLLLTLVVFCSGWGSRPPRGNYGTMSGRRKFSGPNLMMPHVAAYSLKFMHNYKHLSYVGCRAGGCRTGKYVEILARLPDTWQWYVNK